MFIFFCADYDWQRCRRDCWQTTERLETVEFWRWLLHLIVIVLT